MDVKLPHTKIPKTGSVPGSGLGICVIEVSGVVHGISAYLLYILSRLLLDLDLLGVVVAVLLVKGQEPVETYARHLTLPDQL